MSCEKFESILSRYISRRGFLQKGGIAAASFATQACSPISTKPSKKGSPASLTFSEVPHTIDEHLEVPEGYSAQVLLRWGDPLFKDSPEFDPNNQSEASQLKQVGFNCDYVGFLPLPFGSNNSTHGLLAVNHEYATPSMMFPGSPMDDQLSLEQIKTEIAALGLSVVEIKFENNQWNIIPGSQYNRRITPNTPMRMTGPCAGNKRLFSLTSTNGVDMLGTYGNCAGGVTPWGTVLSGEENIDEFFSGNIENCPERENYKRMTFDTSNKYWGGKLPRWDLNKNPNEGMHGGWIVEIDPYNPHSTPKKRSALGRFKHEGANVFINQDNHVVAYSGDDEQFEYIYRFVSDKKYIPENREHNLSLLDSGTLSVAKFHDNGKLTWLPLHYGKGPLTEENGFYSQADVCFDARKAGDLLGATPMDRPEDVDIDPASGRVYAMLTNNVARNTKQVNAANPRAHNSFGQIVEFWPENGDHTRDEFNWDLFLLAGDPQLTVTSYHPDISDKGWFACPDNCTFDKAGNIWVSSDGSDNSGVSDGIWAMPMQGQFRGFSKRFLRIPIGAEVCGPCFTPSNQDFFCAIQHPAKGSTFESPSTRWPDFNDALPPRPSVVVIRKDDGAIVGG